MEQGQYSSNLKNVQNIELFTVVMDPFVNATVRTLGKQFNITVNPESAFVKNDTTAINSSHCAMISLSGDNYNGVVAICFEEKVFLSLMSKVLEESFEEINDEVEDGATEILNIIYGLARTELNKSSGVCLEMSIPTIVSSHVGSIDNFTPDPTVVLPFESEVGKFYIQIGFLED